MLGDERGVPTPIGDVTRTKGHVYKLIARRQTRDDRMHTLAILTCTAKTCAKNGENMCEKWSDGVCVGRRALCGQRALCGPRVRRRQQSIGSRRRQEYRTAYICIMARDLTNARRCAAVAARFRWVLR